ncbi:MAG: SDR family oxidoreductase [Desulfosalsimonas sp.]|uniref:SDR family oxidoreductase n=1 Tax=Desulfosalsimonas sp. TaxID=3073848 RepID=UPI003970F253
MQAALKNKTAIVTGASRGIGRAIALKLGQSGASVVVNYARNAKAAGEVVSQIIESGGQAVSVRADMQKISQINALFDAAEQHFGSIDILVNNAGIALFKKIADITEKEFDDSFALNVKGLFFACQQAAKRMADGGKIINISSSVTKMMLPDYGVYAATKGAVEQITKVLAKELGHRKIAVNAISPGPVDTELFRQGKTEQQIQNLADMAAFGRIGTPGDIAGAVVLLVSGEAGWISGQNLCVNGGFAA